MTVKIFREYTGIEFNRIYKNVKFYKFLRNNLHHFNFTYQLGLNVDFVPFNPTSECSKGGLYFCEESNCHLYYQSYGTKIATVKIPDDARVYVESDKFKADRLIIDEIIDFENVPDEFWLNIFYKSVSALKYIKEQSEDLHISAIKQDGLMLEFVKEEFKTGDLCTLAVEQNSEALKFVPECFQTNDMCTFAICQDANVFRYVKNQTQELCDLAVKKNCDAFKYVEDSYKTKELYEHMIGRYKFVIENFEKYYVGVSVCKHMKEKLNVVQTEYNNKFTSIKSTNEDIIHI